ncbi:hypothetical protein EGK63_01665 [Brevundimonas sp. 357]|nr:hypothetical protein EGK63_01665 [Brevundimonas sp. 357]
MAVGSERLLADEGSYFHTGGPIVRIKRDGERASVELVNDHTLTAVLADRAYWERKGRGNDWTRCDPPPHVVRAVRLGQDRPHLLNLSGLAHQPFYGADGSLVTTPGYDEGTGLYATFNRADFTLKDPTREEAIYALDYLKWLLREFFFVSEKDMAAALSAILTAAVRPTLDQAPAFNISATQSGSGKSHLAKLIVLVATPDEAFNTTYPEKDEEAKKVLLAMLLQKPSAIVFDDMQGSWKPLGPLNRALTSATTTERILGSSQTATARTNTLILGTGNGTEPEGDMRRRVVSIYLDPKGKKAALHRYSKDEPVSHARKNRGSVVVAALTIIEAFRAAGQPFAEVPPIGTFEEWSAKCRHPLIWLGEPDPAESLIEQVRQDPDGDLLEELLDIWSDLFGTRSVTVRKVIEKTAERPDLLDVLADLNLLDGRTVNPGRFGWYLKKNRGRRVGCFRIEPGESLERRSWRVIIN